MRQDIIAKKYNKRPKVEWLTFLANSIKMPLNTGAVMPSSGSLCKEMISKIDFSTKSSIIEIGPGTGAITSYISRKICDGSMFSGIELNEKFVHILQKKHPDFNWYCGSAENAHLLVNKKSFDHVICALPWTIFRESTQVKILESILRISHQGTTFSTFAYLHGNNMRSAKRFQSLLSHYFSDIEKSRVIWKNVPPALVYHTKVK